LRLHAAAIPAVALLLGLALLARPLFHGIAPATIVGFWTAVLGQAMLPGVVLAWGARLVPPGERLLLLGQGATLGLTDVLLRRWMMSWVIRSPSCSQIRISRPRPPASGQALIRRPSNCAACRMFAPASSKRLKNSRSLGTRLSRAMM